jgi:hypothetical protein
MGWTSPRTWVASEIVTAALLNTHLRDNLNAINGFVRKTADESVTSSTTLQNDDHLSIAIPGAGSYEIDISLGITSAANAAGDIRVGATFPAGTMTLFVDALDASLASSHTGTILRHALALTSGVDPGEGFGASTTQTYASLKFLFVATASGTFQFQWAQLASNASATTVKANSFLTMRQMA